MALRLGKCRASPPLNSRSSKERGFESHPIVGFQAYGRIEYALTINSKEILQNQFLHF